MVQLCSQTFFLTASNQLSSVLEILLQLKLGKSVLQEVMRGVLRTLVTVCGYNMFKTSNRTCANANLKDI